MENYPHEMEVLNENINSKWGFNGDFDWDFWHDLPSSKRKHSYGIDGPVVDDLPFFYQVIFQFPTLNSVSNSFRQSRVAHKTENLVS
jgi:hypothetical protein